SRELELYDDDLVDLAVGGKQITGAVFVVPGQAENTVTAYLGWGRKRAGRNGSERGFKAYAPRTTSTPWRAVGGKIRKHRDKYQLVSTRDHHSTEGRHMVRHTTVDDYAKDPHAIQGLTRVPYPEQTMYPGFPDIENAWGMSVDLSKCVGCN